MKLNSTIGLTLLLLTAMLMAGIASAIAGISIGQQALKGVTQPDTRPTSNLTNRQGDAPRKNELVILEENKILESVKARMSGKVSSAPAKATPVTEKKAENQASLPVAGESEGVSMTVKSVKRDGDVMVLALDMKNSTANQVKFLYTFLEIKDDQGRVLSGTTEGLPSELPPDNQSYAGTIQIPITSIDKAQKLSLALSDYPNQKVQLKVSDIPVAQ